VAIERTIDPWSALLDDGRADGRLVRGAFEGGTAAAFAAIPAAAWEGPLIVTTGTASGKSLCFNLPTLEVLCRDAHARALYLYPTKALAQDQARALQRFGLGERLRPAI
jgi:DEAD/DEAH box helicase domain-containing protein